MKPDSDAKKLSFRFVAVIGTAVLLFCLGGILSACASMPGMDFSVSGETGSETRYFSDWKSTLCSPSAKNSAVGTGIRSEIEQEELYLAQKRREEREQYLREMSEQGSKNPEEQQADPPQAEDPLPGFSEAFVSSLTEEEQAEAYAMRDQGFVYYRQNWSVLNDLSYGSEGFGLCGCGPTCVAEIVSTLAGVELTPDQVREKAIASYSVLENGATGYGFIVSTVESYGIHAEQHHIYEKDAALEALSEGAILFITVGPGDFTLGSHFMLARGLTETGKVLISDSYSFEHSVAEWDWDYLAEQMKNGIWYFFPEDN